MLRAVTLRALALVALTLMLGACASAREVEQRTTQGPTADQLWMYRMVLTNGREPNFEERMYWQNDLEDQIGRYLRTHPTEANSLEVSTFRFYRRVAVGMTKDQVVILLGPPLKTTTDAPQMEKAARQYRPHPHVRPNEAWDHPRGRVFYLPGGLGVQQTP